MGVPVVMRMQQQAQGRQMPQRCHVLQELQSPNPSQIAASAAAGDPHVRLSSCSARTWSADTSTPARVALLLSQGALRRASTASKPWAKQAKGSPSGSGAITPCVHGSTSSGCALAVQHTAVPPRDSRQLLGHHVSKFPKLTADLQCRWWRVPRRAWDALSHALEHRAAATAYKPAACHAAPTQSATAASWS